MPVSRLAECEQCACNAGRKRVIQRIELISYFGIKDKIDGLFF